MGKKKDLKIVDLPHKEPVISVKTKNQAEYDVLKNINLAVLIGIVINFVFQVDTVGRTWILTVIGYGSFFLMSHLKKDKKCK